MIPLAPAGARSQDFSLSIPAGRLADALAALSASTGASFASDGPLPAMRVPALRGRMSLDAALRRLLAGLGYVARRAGPHAYRIVRITPEPANTEETALPADIIVTARKLIERLDLVPAPISVYLPDDDPRGAVPGDARSVASKVGGLTVSNFGAGRDRLFLRAIADSPFDGFSQTAVSVQLDDARVTYDAPDPSLRLVDVERVEVLKGPQGPLYGTGALGGVYRVVTRRPVLDEALGNAAFGLDEVVHGGLGGSGELMANLPLLPDRAAVRIVAYAAAEPGWIDDGTGARNANQMFTRGARIAGRAGLSSRWNVNLALTAQRIDARDADYVDRDAEQLSRASPIREPHGSSLTVLAGTVEGAIGRLPLLISAGRTWQSEASVYDASAASAALGVAEAKTYRDRREHRIFDQEVRLGSAPGDPLQWVAGLSYLAAITRAYGELRTATTDLPGFFRLHRNVSEAAAYGDLSFPIASKVRGEIGARVFRTGTEDERTGDDSAEFAAKALVGFTPSVSLSYRTGVSSVVYARLATAFRPGGIDPGNVRTGRYDADEVRTLDVGGRVARGPWRIEGGVFGSAWLHVQSDYLQDSGLVATRNAGDAHVVGSELSFEWNPEAWSISTGATYQRGRLIRGADGSDLPDDRRLPVVPDVTGRFEVRRKFAMDGASVEPYFSGSFTGPARLSFDPGLDRKTPSYAMFDLGMELIRGDLSLRAGVINLLDARADTFAFGNPFSVRSIRQYTPLRPRLLSVSVRKSF